jgi:hypothetical protein
VRQTGNRWTTLLLAALVVVETSDTLFAVDSVHAVLSVTQTAFVAYLLIVFAVLGLRALYFVLEGLIARFVYLHYGLAAILVFVGGSSWRRASACSAHPRLAARDRCCHNGRHRGLSRRHRGGKSGGGVKKLVPTSAGNARVAVDR